jgi:putative aldouronate transport system permease protein
LCCLLPFVLLFTSSVTDEQSLFQDGYQFVPKQFSLLAYEYLWAQRDLILNAYTITIVVTLVGTCLGLFFSALLAYPLSRKETPWSNFFSFFVFFTMIFNGGLVPTYLLYTHMLHVKDTIWALILPTSLLIRAFYVMIMRTYYKNSIPEEILESAKMDGAGTFRTFFSIVMPLSTPILATIGLFIGVDYWNDWYNGFIYLTDPDYFSIQVLLNRILFEVQFLATADLGSSASSAATELPSSSIRMAIAVVGVIPIMILYPFFQKYFVKGITIGAVKG